MIGGLTANIDERKSYIEQERQTSGKKFRKGIDREVHGLNWTQLTCLERQRFLANAARKLEIGTSVKSAPGIAAAATGAPT